MKEYKEIFAVDIEIPDIVSQKMEEAFDKINKERTSSINNIIGINDRRSKRIRLFKNQVAAIVCICILMLGSVTAYAACNYFWSRGMKGTLQATDIQQQKLVEAGIATMLQDAENYTNMAVTDGGITVTPEMVVVNEKMVYLSLSVEGYELQEGKAPCFEFVDVYLGDNPKAEEGWFNMEASFYNGIVSGEDGASVYEDGTPLITDGNGNIVSHYTDASGKMDYVIVAMVSEPDKSLLGETLHVELSNLGTGDKADFIGAVEGKWDFIFTLSDVSLTEMVQIGEVVEGTVFVLDSMEISPVSIKLNYDVNGKATMHEDINGVPGFCGIVLKDGTRLPYLKNGGMSGYTDDTLSKAFEISAFERVIEPNQVSAILLRTEDGAEMVEIGLGR